MSTVWTRCRIMCGLRKGDLRGGFTIAAALKAVTQIGASRTPSRPRGSSTTLSPQSQRCIAGRKHAQNYDLAQSERRGDMGEGENRVDGLMWNVEHGILL